MIYTYVCVFILAYIYIYICQNVPVMAFPVVSVMSLRGYTCSMVNTISLTQTILRFINDTIVIATVIEASFYRGCDTQVFRSCNLDSIPRTCWHVLLGINVWLLGICINY